MIALVAVSGTTPTSMMTNIGVITNSLVTTVLVAKAGEANRWLSRASDSRRYDTRRSAAEPQ